MLFRSAAPARASPLPVRCRLSLRRHLPPASFLPAFPGFFSLVAPFCPYRGRSVFCLLPVGGRSHGPIFTNCRMDLEPTFSLLRIPSPYGGECSIRPALLAFAASQTLRVCSCSHALAIRRRMLHPSCLAGACRVTNPQGVCSCSHTSHVGGMLSASALLSLAASQTLRVCSCSHSLRLMACACSFRPALLAV